MTHRVGGSWNDVYLYDADDERVASVNALSGAPYTWPVTLRGADQKVLRELTSALSGWTWSKDYVYRDGQLLATIAPDPSFGTRVTHLHLDQVGTPRLATDESGISLTTHKYWPFGTESPGSADTERMKFTGHERDLMASAGGVPDVHSLDYMHARYYDASMGRLSVDPVVGQQRDPQSWNRYSYVLNNPINKADPSGKCVWDL
jgi:RHS repeat-associated protein